MFTPNLFSSLLVHCRYNIFFSFIKRTTFVWEFKNFSALIMFTYFFVKKIHLNWKKGLLKIIEELKSLDNINRIIPSCKITNSKCFNLLLIRPRNCSFYKMFSRLFYLKNSKFRLRLTSMPTTADVIVTIHTLT